jgi:hypothetical protein
MFLTGFILGYEFNNQKESAIISRRKIEKKSLEKIRGEFQAHLGAAEQDLQTHIVTLEKLNLKQCEKFEEQTQRYETILSATQTKINEYEDLYKNKLMLEAPVTQWEKRAIDLNGKGKIFLICVIGLIIFSASLLSYILFGMPDLLKIFEDKANAIRFSVLIIAILSLLGYGIRVLAKLTFSTMHLARDAEERKQLTYVYWALKKEGHVSDGDRQLILQSLFSRSDSGLLKDDGSPTLPNNIIEKIGK